MRACSCASGGAMFIPDALNEKHQVVSYREFLESEVPQQERPKLFGRRGKDAAKSSENLKDSEKAA